MTDDTARAVRLARNEGRRNALTAVAVYIRSINGNGRDEPSDPALDAVQDKVAGWLEDNLTEYARLREEKP